MLRNKYGPRCSCAGCCGPFRIPRNNPDNVRFLLDISATDVNTGQISVIDGSFIIIEYSYMNGVHDLPFSGIGSIDGAYSWSVTERDPSDPSRILRFFTVRAYDPPIPPEAFAAFSSAGVYRWPQGPLEPDPDSPIVARVRAQGARTQGSGLAVIEYYVSEKCTRYYNHPGPPLFMLPPYAQKDQIPGVDVTRVVIRNAVNADA